MDLPAGTRAGTGTGRARRIQSQLPTQLFHLELNGGQLLHALNVALGPLILDRVADELPTAAAADPVAAPAPAPAPVVAAGSSATARRACSKTYP